MKFFVITVLLLFQLNSKECCQTRSMEDPERKYSHQGKEEDYRPSTEPDAEALKEKEKLEQGIDLQDENRERETGEVFDKTVEKWEFPVAQTKVGMLWGTVEESRGGKRILAFRGIRHLKPPTGTSRFKPPSFEPKWEGIREAKHNGHVCPQHLATKPDIWVGNEDCLWLNVFTRDLVMTKSRPVMVWIHGGNFARGSAADYQPDYLLDEDVVLVTIQYRLGMFGFLSTEDAFAPGNYGMLDQVAALQWIRQNIEAFSGDPNKITIIGQQAGGASVHYHLLSPLSRGLFNRAVSLSGTALCWWASLKRPLERSKKLAKLVSCPEDNTEELLKCLREKPMESLMNTHPNFYEWKHLEQSQEPMTAWSPRVDKESPISFMPEEPIDLMTSGNFQHLPWIVGLTDDEGAVRTTSFLTDMAGVREFEDNFEKLGPLMFGLHDGQSEAPKILAKKIKDYYWGVKPLDINNALQLSSAISDSSYAHPIDTAAKVHAMKSAASVFIYHFVYRGQHSHTKVKPNQFPPKLVEPLADFGVGNGDDLIYIFPVMGGLFRPLSIEDLNFSHRLIWLLTSFAKTGVPKLDDENPQLVFEWQAANPQNISHLNIGNVMDNEPGLPNNSRMKFWQSMPAYWNADRANYAPAPPPAMAKEEL